MSTYDQHGNTPGGYAYEAAARGWLELETLIELAEGLTAALHAEYPALVGYGESIEAELALSAEDGLPPNRGRIRSALEAVSIGAGAGTGSLTYTQRLINGLKL
ncbi:MULTISPECIES: hypothetical protein [unclassified Streptomyces]|uniref:hypothetical protein n=1 Tax=unclassified Streptomyces TaxID=2593676 RepID=UPI0013694E18|nr:hypothetical protein [Streptomyces sp. SID4985]MYQ44325.1 hypothetical protein [Streptomyces sp. SID4985]